MKRNLIAAAAVFAALLLSLTSCEKEGTRRFEGNYSFKTSGTLTIDRKVTSSDVTLPTTDGTFKSTLTSESGQMNIVTTGENTMVVTFNIIGGDVLVFDATVDGKKITLSPISRIITIKDDGLTFTIDATLEGTGERYDDVVVFTLNYTGSTSYLVYDYTITESSVKCVAKVNK